MKFWLIILVIFLLGVVFGGTVRSFLPIKLPSW